MKLLTYGFWISTCWNISNQLSQASPTPGQWPRLSPANDSIDDYRLIEGLWLVTTHAHEIQSIIKLSIEKASDYKHAILHGEIYRTFKLKGKPLPVICEHGSKSYQGKPLRGLRIIKELRPKSSDWNTPWEKGEIFNPENNLRIKAQVRLIKQDTVEFSGKFRGIKRSARYQRIDENSAQLKQLEQRAEQELQAHLASNPHR
ncbi:MAG: hypothetical protein CMF55_05445 [Legionellales bacterium]|nr:hypothetical protein [Legionellales bacterium]